MELLAKLQGDPGGSGLSDDKSLAKLHEALGNDPDPWFIRAVDLLRAAEILYDNIGQPPAPSEWFSLHNIGRMLRGMGLECLLKSAWLRAGNVLFKNGDFVEIPETKSHDLYSMYKKVTKKRRIILNPEEKELLARLSYAIVGARYPVPKSPGRGYPTAPKPKTKMYWNKCEHEKDTEVFRSMLTKFLEAATDSA
jgi:hypothetical protein